jgi:hypothetical protein
MNGPFSSPPAQPALSSHPSLTEGRVKWLHRFIWQLTSLLVASLFPPPLYSQGPTIFGGTGAVLMKHGDVISGELAPMGDQISIRIDENNSVFIPLRQIEYSARTVDEIYQFKVKKYGRIGTGEHYQLALWCLKNKLNDQAVFHYEELKRMVPNDPIVKRLAFQVKETILQEPWAKEIIRQQNEFRAAHSTSNSVVTASADSNQAGGVQTAGGTKSNSATTPAGRGSLAPPTTSPPQSIPRATAKPQPFATSDTAAKQLTFEPLVTEDATKLFRSHLQPILLQKCGQSGCHGNQSTNDLKLLRPTANSTKKTADSNIASLLPFLDAADAQKSTLYQLATKPHGSLKTGAIGQVDNDGSDELLGWIKLIVLQTEQKNIGLTPSSLGVNSNPTSPASSPNSSSQLWQQHLDRLPGGAPGTIGNNERPNFNDAPIVSVQNYDSSTHQPFLPDISKEITPSELDKLEEEIRRAEAAEKAGQGNANPTNSVDPFDPNAFNNQYRKPE